MQCDICHKKKATVHLTEIVDDQMSEMHLCENCAKEKSVQMEQQFGLADLLAGLSDFGPPVKEKKEVETKCENCGTTYEDFRKFGRMGCGKCYSSFRSHLSTLLKKIHGSNKHTGKRPKNFVEPKEEKTIDSAPTVAVVTVESLKQELAQAISCEDFERAAELRDKIRDLEIIGEE